MLVGKREKKEARTLKEALYRTVHHHPALSVEAMAEQLIMAPSYLYRAVTPDPDTEGPEASGVRFPLRQLIPLIRITNDFQALDYIERALGRVGVPIPPVQESSLPGDICRGSITAAAEFGALMRELEYAIEDGRVTEGECERVGAAGWEAIQAIMAMIVRCERGE